MFSVWLRPTDDDPSTKYENVRDVVKYPNGKIVLVFDDGETRDRRGEILRVRDVE